MELREYPRPQGDNGRGIHWFTTQSAGNPVVDTYINECRAMHIKWVVFLNGFDWALTANDYLVDKLIQNDMMPILRVLTHPTGPLPADLPTLVSHYVPKGVRYFQIHNEPNLKGEWPNNDFPPNMMAKFAEWWCDAALKVIDAGGLPGLPGLATAGGEYGLGQGEDLKYFSDALDAIHARLTPAQRTKVYNKLWISLHNYNVWARDPITTPVTPQDSHCFKKFIIYDQVVRQKIGRSLPILGTEGGTRLGIRPDNPYTDTRDENVVADHTARSFAYVMDNAPDYFFCHSPWVLASQLAGNTDPFFEETAWYRANGSRQKVVDVVKAMPSHERVFSWDKPAKVEFTADSTDITQGESTTLRWTTQNVASVTLNGANVPVNGQQAIQPAATTTYTLRAVPSRQGAAVIERTLTITVQAATGPGQPPIINIASELPQYPRGGAPGPYPTRTLSEIQMLILHHTNWETATPEALAAYLVDKLHWPGIGYHFMIMKDGTIYQTNELTTVSYHSYDGNDPLTAPRNWDRQSLGVALVGQFKPGHLPTQAQLESSGKLCAWLLGNLHLTESAIWGRCELMTNPAGNPSPGCVKDAGRWLWIWRDSLLAEIRKYMGPAGPEVTPPSYHYLLFWKHADNWAQEDWAGAQTYIQRFLPTCGFDVEEAKQYTNISIVGGPFGVPESDEQALKDAGRHVERLAGEGFAGTAALLNDMAQKGQRFLHQ
ncbi:MAG: N-acetylmuramoyl-L-alanine amidase [Chloroflexi bacterium]|nr:N-acetylmuramoyl-L-alanine amidase [Chloroflexota bacterium]MBU1749444.1 N-acetylmuramoyl-L-alanine amidase [Chloroflexota bacterium]